MTCRWAVSVRMSCSNPALAHIGVVYQTDNLIEEFTAHENVTFPLRVAGVEWAQKRIFRQMHWLEARRRR